MENKFYKVMSGHSDEKLLEVYKNKSDYNEDAVLAMEIVIKERGLEAAAIKVEDDKKVEEKLSYEEQIKKFQIAEFGKIISDKDFVEQSLKSNIYLQKNISPLHNFGWINSVFIILGITGLVSFLILLFMGEFKGEFLMILIISLLVALLLPLGIWRTKQNRTELILLRTNSKTTLTIGKSNQRISISLPFHYEFYWEWHYIKRNFKQLKLYVYLYDDSNNAVYVIHELISPLKKPAPHWKQLPNNLTSQLKGKSIYVYMNYGFQTPFIYSFQKLLDGLHNE